MARTVKPRRKYNRTGRAQAAAATRDAIATAARLIFRERGFAGTTMESIAAEAGYAPQTVYFHFGTKAAILKHLVEESKSERVIPLYQRSLAAEDPREQLALAVSIGRFGAEAGWDLTQVRVLGSLASGLIARRLRTHHLVGEPFASVAEAVGWFGAVQSQDYPAAKWALGQRIHGAVDTDIDAAFDRGDILRTHVLRPT